MFGMQTPKISVPLHDISTQSCNPCMHATPTLGLNPLGQWKLGHEASQSWGPDMQDRPCLTTVPIGQWKLVHVLTQTLFWNS